MSDVLELAKELIAKSEGDAAVYKWFASWHGTKIAQAVIALSARVEELENKIATDEAAIKEYNELMQKITDAGNYDSRTALTGKADKGE